MVYAQTHRSVGRYVWSSIIALFSLLLLNGNPFPQALASTVPSSATLIVIKEVTNNNGGTLSASDFGIKVTVGLNATPDTFQGSASGTVVTLDPGDYEVRETPPSGYAVSYSADCSGTIGMGETKTCTITNDDIAPTLKLLKTVQNNNGGAATANDFQAQIDGNNVAWGVATALTAGTHTASEVNLPGYTASTWGGDCGANGAITLALGQNATCTITNDDIGATLRLLKTVTNNNGGTATASSFQAKIDGNNVNWGVQVPVNIGAHTASETTLPGYTASSWGGDCGTNGTITLTPGQNATCTITNDDIAPTLKLVKTVQNNHGGTAVANDFQAKIDGNNVNWGTAIPVNAGAHTVSETGLPGYTASGWGGDCAANGTITLVVGQVATCSITNSDSAATLKLVKTVINNHGGSATAANFQAKIDGGNVAWNTATPVGPGVHIASEVNLPGYQASAWGGDCAANGQVTLALGENKTCTITNDDTAATLIVIKKVINDHGGTLTAGQFNLKVTGNTPNPATFAGDENGTVVALGPGSYSVSETPPTGYSATYSADCAGTIALGETKTCTVTNDDKPARLRIVKTVVNNNGGTLAVPDFPLFIDGIPVTSGAFISVTAGLHTMSETPHPLYIGTFSSNCAGGQTTLTLGQQRTCTLTNDDKPIGITIQKTASSSSVQPGTAVVYSYKVGNTAAAPLTSISVSDDKCTPVQPVNNGQLNSGDSNRDNNLDPGEEWKYSCTATLLVDTLNTATAQGTPVGGGAPVSHSAQAAVDVLANLQVTKTASTATVSPVGENVNFTVKIRNLSQGDQVTIQSLQDSLYGNITDDNNPKIVATNCIAPRNIAPGSTYTCIFTALVSGTPGQDHINTVTATGVDDDEQPVSGNASATVKIAGSALQPTKSATLAVDADQNGVVSPGDTLEYTIGLQNHGAEPALGLVFEDAPDGNSALINGSVQTSQGTVTLGNASGQAVVLVEIGTLQSQATVTIRFKVKINEILPSNATQLVNQGTLGGQNLPLILTDDPSTLAVGDATITPITLTPLVAGAKSVQLLTDTDNNGVATAGDTLEYKIVISNRGSRTANAMLLNDSVDAQTLLVVGSVQSTRGTVTKGNQTGDSAVQVNIGNLGGGATAEVTFQVIIKNPLPAGVTQVSNQGFISGANFPTTATDDPSTATPGDPTRTQVTIGPVLDALKVASVSIDADQNGQPGPGDTLHYQVRILNSGNAQASAVAFADKLDANTTLVAGSVTSNQGDITVGNGSTDAEVNVALNTLPSGGEVIITYKALINNPLPPSVLKVANQGLVTSQELPPVLTDDPTTSAVDDPTQTQVRILPQIVATKRATLLLDTDGDQVAEPGDTLLYEVALVNNGNATATALNFVDTVDLNTTLVPDSVQTSQGSVQSGNSAGDTQVRVAIGSLAGNGNSANLSYQATIKDPLPAQTVEIINQGTVQSQELDPVLTDDPNTGATGDATRTQVIASPRLQVIKQDLLWIDADDDRQVTFDDHLLYQIKIVNTGNVAAINVLLQDTIDPRTLLVSNSVQSSQGSIQQGNNVGDPAVVINLGAIPPKGVVNIGFRVQVKANENGQIANQATLIHEQPAPSGTRAQPIQLLSDDPDTAESSDPTLTPIAFKNGIPATGGQRIYMPVVRRAAR